MMENRDTMYAFIENHAKQKKLRDTLLALPLLEQMMGKVDDIQHMNIDGITRYRGHYEHALQVCKLLISLPLPLNQKEEDIILAAALCHVIPNKFDYQETVDLLLIQHKMDPQVCEIISLIINDNDLSAEGQKRFYERIKQDRLALIVFLADRANLVQQLYNMSIWSAREYIFETRSYFLPLCIDAKELYPELLFTLNILMEKVRTLVDACMILLSRYETREMELTEDILNYQEENSRIRGIISQMKQRKEGKNTLL